MDYLTLGLKECMASLGLDCDTADAIIDLAAMIPVELSDKIESATGLKEACS